MQTHTPTTQTLLLGTLVLPAWLAITGLGAAHYGTILRAIDRLAVTPL